MNSSKLIQTIISLIPFCDHKKFLSFFEELLPLLSLYRGRYHGLPCTSSILGPTEGLDSCYIDGSTRRLFNREINHYIVWFKEGIIVIQSLT